MKLIRNSLLMLAIVASSTVLAQDGEKYTGQLFTILKSKESERENLERISPLFPSYTVRKRAMAMLTRKKLPTLPRPNINEVRKGKTPILIAVEKGYPFIARYLINRGAEIEKIVPDTRENFFSAVESRLEKLPRPSLIEEIVRLGGPTRDEIEREQWETLKDNLEIGYDTTPAIVVRRKR